MAREYEKKKRTIKSYRDRDHINKEKGRSERERERGKERGRAGKAE